MTTNEQGTIALHEIETRAAEARHGSDERPLLTEWRNCGDGVCMERVRVDGGECTVRASVNDYYVVAPDGQSDVGAWMPGVNACDRADKAARRWYRLPEDAAPVPPSPRETPAIEPRGPSSHRRDRTRDRAVPEQAAMSACETCKREIGPRRDQCGYTGSVDCELAAERATSAFLRSRSRAWKAAAKRLDAILRGQVAEAVQTVARMTAAEAVERALAATPYAVHAPGGRVCARFAALSEAEWFAAELGYTVHGPGGEP